MKSLKLTNDECESCEEEKYHQDNNHIINNLTMVLDPTLSSGRSRPPSHHHLPTVHIKVRPDSKQTYALSQKQAVKQKEKKQNKTKQNKTKRNKLYFSHSQFLADL